MNDRGWIVGNSFRKSESVGAAQAFVLQGKKQVRLGTLPALCPSARPLTRLPGITELPLPALRAEHQRLGGRVPCRSVHRAMREC